MHTVRVLPRRWRESLSPAQGALHTSADAEKDAVVCSVALVLQLFCFLLFLSELSKNPLVFSKRIKSVLYTHSLGFIKINQQINLDFFFFFCYLCIK